MGPSPQKTLVTHRELGREAGPRVSRRLPPSPRRPSRPSTFGAKKYCRGHRFSFVDLFQVEFVAAEDSAQPVKLTTISQKNDTKFVFLLPLYASNGY